MLVNLQVTLFVLRTWFLYGTFCQEKLIQNARVFTTFFNFVQFSSTDRDEKYYASSSTAAVAAVVLVASAEANNPPLSAKVDNQSLLGPVGP